MEDAAKLAKKRRIEKLQQQEVTVASQRPNNR